MSLLKRLSAAAIAKPICEVSWNNGVQLDFRSYGDLKNIDPDSDRYFFLCGWFGKFCAMLHRQGFTSLSMELSNELNSTESKEFWASEMWRHTPISKKEQVNIASYLVLMYSKDGGRQQGEMVVTLMRLRKIATALKRPISKDDSDNGVRELKNAIVKDFYENVYPKVKERIYAEFDKAHIEKVVKSIGWDKAMSEYMSRKIVGHEFDVRKKQNIVDFMMSNKALSGRRQKPLHIVLPSGAVRKVA